MMRTLISALLYILANAVGLLIAAFFLDGFRLDFAGFFVATLLLSIVEAVAGPMIAKMSRDNVPALQGGIALVTTFVGLGITNLIVQGMSIGGLGTWLAATLLVWLGALIATLILPKVLFKATMGSNYK
ncbi:phage holin family protein [Tropicimonas isoalkanivorans]|uniref:4 TMS phage holin, superfamily IV n=1 Tax=Tropicimonas isoalkanivorans TaxID=441112 RepID=A0A1I1N786_9RHOB|nr:phage holin family protein [Tropicimonas isoalkanivorans]SFC93489.1 4 TMS phage holin, superfamily IV [Tropicimonas isoalkanivorans]